MAAVFQELVLEWEGNEYRITPTMSLINRIEAQDISLSGIALMTSQGRPPFGHIATAVALILQQAGVKDATPEKVYGEITRMEADVLTGMIEAIMLAAFPWSGKAEAPATSPKKNTRTKAK